MSRSLSGRMISFQEITDLPSWQIMTDRERKIVKLVLKSIKEGRVSTGSSLVESVGGNPGRALVKSDGHNYSHIEQTNSEDNMSLLTNVDEKSMPNPSSSEVNVPASSGSSRVMPFASNNGFPNRPYVRANNTNITT